jgi:hypothetical protein
MFAQELFGLTWERGGRTKALQEFVPNFLWTYGNIDDVGEAVNIVILCYLHTSLKPPLFFL